MYLLIFIYLSIKTSKPQPRKLKTTFVENLELLQLFGGIPGIPGVHFNLYYK